MTIRKLSRLKLKLWPALAIILLIVLAAAGCNKNTPVLDVTGPTSTPTPPANTAPTIYRAFPIDCSQFELHVGWGYVSELKIFTCIWPVEDFLVCDGRLLPIRDNESLYSLLMTKFGGDGNTNFAIPNMTQQSPLSGLTYYICDHGAYPTEDSNIQTAKNVISYYPQSSGTNVYTGEIVLATGVDEYETGLLLCDGRSLYIGDHQDLFSIIGIKFGGDGRRNFNIPDMSAVASPIDGAKYYIVVSGEWLKRQ